MALSARVPDSTFILIMQICAHLTSLTEAVIIGRFPGFGRADGADDFGPVQVRGVFGNVLLITWRHTDDVVKETWVEN